MGEVGGLQGGGRFVVDHLNHLTLPIPILVIKLFPIRFPLIPPRILNQIRQIILHRGDLTRQTLPLTRKRRNLVFDGFAAAAGHLDMEFGFLGSEEDFVAGIVPHFAVF